LSYSEKLSTIGAMIKIATDLERRGVFERLLLEEEIELRKIEEDRAKRNNTPANWVTSGLDGSFPGEP